MLMNTLIGDGQQTPSELAHRLRLSPGATSVVLNRLEAAGHVERHRQPSDGRKLLVTPEARDRQLPPWCRTNRFTVGISRLAADLTHRRADNVDGFLDRLSAVYDQVKSTSKDNRRK
jgi:DNA-binding MarR family transcriptional regulator